MSTKRLYKKLVDEALESTKTKCLCGQTAGVREASEMETVNYSSVGECVAHAHIAQSLVLSEAAALGIAL